MGQILGLDLGTNSIGWSIRNTDLSENEIEKFGVVTFEKGVGNGKTGEFSFAAERTKHRAGRRLNQARKYRLWATLEVLIKFGYCPMTIERLDKWRKYDKETKRAYPHIEIFEQWIRLDFNNDGKPDYFSPYQLRAELVETKLDLTIESNRFKIGRALYHIAQRRGFKSSRKDAQATDTSEGKEAKSELKKNDEFEKELQKQFEKSLSDFKTIGCALHFIETQKQRVRLNWIQHTFRKQYKEEITTIFEFQNIGIESDYYKNLVENKKNRFNGAIFFQRPLRSQKGLVGKCTLEPNKSRCPISHPAFEEFRALSLLNNIQYKQDGVWYLLTTELKQEIYDTSFFRKSKPNFHFEEIRKKMEKSLNLKLDYKAKTINYNDKTNVSACPVSSSLKEIFGENWKDYKKETITTRTTINKKGETKTHTISYNIHDIWHVLFSFEDDEIVKEFAIEKLNLDLGLVDKFVAAWKRLQDGYAMLSLNAIEKINVFLRQGFIYSEAVMLANMPSVLGKNLWIENIELLTTSIKTLIEQNQYEKRVRNIANILISKYKALPDNEQFAFRNTDYKLDESDKKEILQTIIGSIGEKTWEKANETYKSMVLDEVTYSYQSFFQNSKREFYILPRVSDTIALFIKQKFPEISNKKLQTLYHPSMIEIYPSTKRNEDGKIYLQSPKTGSFKNPMAMRTLHELRKLINYLIKTGQIDEETRIVVETARELNDANKRWAIEAYQKQREAENNEFKAALKELLNNGTNTNPENSEYIDKVRLWYEQLENNNPIQKGKGEYAQQKWENSTTELIQESYAKKTDIEKYRLWKEQQCVCMYTGKMISLTDLFDENKVDFEHTIPRSISFDNSLANLTVCYAQYNRQIKGNMIPTQLPNYEQEWSGYQSIKPRLKAWEGKVQQLKTNIEFWKGKSKSASDKNYKDDAIRQRHLWQMELDYWQNKLNRFTMTEVTNGFKNSQLIDTQLISKYALHYLKTAFNRVDVQKGNITADFRKILGIQEMYVKKSRDKHSHHAIDATVLTIIPTAAKRDEILQIFYEYLENKQLQKNDIASQIKERLSYKLKQLYLPNIEYILNKIEETILINNSAKDQTLTPGKKIVRRRGKVVYQRDKQGDLIKDVNGNLIPKIAQGDCIRGELHKDTFYGKIKQVKRNEDGTLLKDENGNWIYEKKNEGFKFVVRKPVTLITKLEQIVSFELQNAIKQQLNGRTLEIAFKEGVYMLNKQGNPIGNSIRHIRCYADDVTNPIIVKKQTYTSKHNYKNNLYAKNGENILYAIYWDGKSKSRSYDIRSLINLASFDSGELLSFFELTKEVGRGKNKEFIPLYAVIKSGTKVLFYKERKEELLDLSQSDYSNRLYVMNRIFDPNDGRIQFQHHLEARDDKRLLEAFSENEFGKKGKNGFSEIDFLNPFPRLLLSIGKFNFITENYDFVINPDGNIKFLF
ncbi:MAG: type II CRISPR RNA-guided endonuclease Cas9 [Bacteroidales bacterium]